MSNRILSRVVTAAVAVTGLLALGSPATASAAPVQKPAPSPVVYRAYGYGTFNYGANFAFEVSKKADGTLAGNCAFSNAQKSKGYCTKITSVYTGSSQTGEFRADAVVNGVKTDCGFYYDDNAKVGARDSIDISCGGFTESESLDSGNIVIDTAPKF